MVHHRLLQRRRSWGLGPGPNVLSAGGPTVEWAHPICNLKQFTHVFGIIAVAVLRMVSSLVIYTHITISSELFPNISVCYRAVKDRHAIVAIFKIFWSLLSVKALKLPPPHGQS